MSEPLAYLYGRRMPRSEARLGIHDCGVILGATVTEMVRTFHHELYRLEAHLDRLRRSLRYVRFDIGMSMESLADIARELVEHNAKLIAADDELALVMFVTAGDVPAYAGAPAGTPPSPPTVCVHTFPLAFERYPESLSHGQHLVTPSIRHVPPQCYDPKMKYRSRMHYYLADQEARLADPSASALLLDLDGNVTETSGANFLIVENDTIVSPSRRNILAGVSRSVVIELADELGIPFVERDLQVFDVINAQEAFTSSTPYCILPVTKINGLLIGDGKPGPVFRRVLSAWSAAVGIDIERQIVEGAERRRRAKPSPTPAPDSSPAG